MCCRLWWLFLSISLSLFCGGGGFIVGCGCGGNGFFGPLWVLL